MAKVVLKRGRANPLWHGHPWVYSGADRARRGRCRAGRRRRRVRRRRALHRARLRNPRSQIRVRMVTARDEPVDAALIARRLEEAQRAARAARSAVGDDHAYRLVNSEGDALPGLVVDVYGDVCAVQFTALGMKKREVELYDALAELLAPRAIVEVAAGRLRADRGLRARRRAWCAATTRSAPVRCRENGLDARGRAAARPEDRHVPRPAREPPPRRRAGQGRARARRLHLRRRLRADRAARRRRDATCVDASARALERVRAPRRAQPARQRSRPSRPTPSASSRRCGRAATTSWSSIRRSSRARKRISTPRSRATSGSTRSA